MTDQIIEEAEAAIEHAKRKRRAYLPWQRLLREYKAARGANVTLAEEVQRLTTELDNKRSDFDIAIGLLGWGDEAVPGTVEGLVRAIQAQVREDLTERDALREEKESLRRALLDAAAMSTYTIDPNNLHQLLRVVGLVHQDEIKDITAARDEAVQVATDEHNAHMKALAESRGETIEQYKALLAVQDDYFAIIRWLPPRVLQKWQSSDAYKRQVEKAKNAEEATSGES